jgi:hypothetical protein
MATIRLAIIEQLKKNFDQTVFSKHMFEFSSNKQEHVLKITFLGNPDFQFQIKELPKPKQDRFKFITIESPGHVSIEAEHADHENLNNAHSRAYGWARRIEEDYIIAAPEDNELENFRKQFFEQFDESKADDSHFNYEEQNLVNKRMNDFEKKLEKLYSEKHATQQQVNEMKQQIEILKKSVEILDKRTWLSAACNRVFDIVKEVKGAKKEITTLLGDMKMDNLLPDCSNDEKQEDVA